MSYTDNAHPLLRIYTGADVQARITLREGEQKLGESVHTLPEGSPLAALKTSGARYVLLGIPEDIGVRANGGIGGAYTLWEPALKAFLNMQEHPACSGDHILLLGAYGFDHWMEASETMNADRMRALVDYIDEAVYPVIEAIVHAGKIPVVIGGGHNNALPLLQGSAYAKDAAINCVNLDAHSDYRRLEGRHSGNPFRYAKRDGFLDRYAMIGLHWQYNSAAVLADIAADSSLHASFYEDIFLEGQPSYDEALSEALRHVAGKPTGIELDMDCIAGVLSSAATPAGITPLDARRYLRRCAREADAAYLHIAEGAVALRDGRADIGTAKLVAYLLHDFMSAMHGKVGLPAG